MYIMVLEEIGIRRYHVGERKEKMKLSELNQYEKITIQTHNDPDADAIASGYGLYCYFKAQGKEVDLVYGGYNEIKKANLVLMVSELEIPLRYIGANPEPVKEGLLITVDCQYGEGNVAKLEAPHIAIIDHHQQNKEKQVDYCMICSYLGGCATLVWDLLRQEGFSMDVSLQTALYYGLYMDTAQLTEISHPLDKDMRDSLHYNRMLVKKLQNSNLNMKELEIAGVALIRCIYNAEYEYALVAAEPCDPNILGLISDLVLQVSEVKTCLVFNVIKDELIKLSVRSCDKEIQADHLARFLVREVNGFGGGHLDKAGGAIPKERYNEKYRGTDYVDYFNKRMQEYMEYYPIIHAETQEEDLTKCKKYVKKSIEVGYVKATDVVPVGTPVLVRTLEGDLDLIIEEDTFIMIGIQGEVYPMKKEKFERSYRPMSEQYNLEVTYKPTIRNSQTGEVFDLTGKAKTCMASGGTEIYARPLEKGARVFTSWDKEKYMRGEAGDLLAIREDDVHDIYIIEKSIFAKTYEACE